MLHFTFLQIIKENTYMIFYFFCCFNVSCVLKLMSCMRI